MKNLFQLLQRGMSDKHGSYRLPLVWCLVVNLMAVYVSLPFYQVPHGAGIRPMAWSVFIFFLAFLGLISIPFAVLRKFKHRDLSWPIVCILLALMPLPIGFVMVGQAQRLRGFTFLQ